MKSLFHSFCQSDSKSNERLYQDINLDEVFEKVDFTHSIIGKQYLYHILRSPALDIHSVIARESLIKSLSVSEESLLKKLSEFNKSYCALIPRLIFEKQGFDIPILKYAYWTVSLMVISALLIKLSWVFILLACLFGLFNSTLFFINKFRLEQLMDIVRCYYDFSDLSHFIKHKAQLKETEIQDFESHALLKTFGRFIVKKGSNNSVLRSELQAISESFVEMLSSFFCLEYFFIEFFLARLAVDKEKLLGNYQAIGEIDIAISIGILRRNPKTCIPSIHESILNTELIYHPLIDACIGNSIKIQDNNIVLNGSNMSGKTSLIKTIAVNQLLFQTLNTCFAKSYSAPLFNIHSMINMSDSVSENVSYFKNEIDCYKEIIEKTITSNQPNLIIIDEPLKGTNTDYSTAISFGVLKAISEQKGNVILLTTHSFELSDLLEERLDFDRYSFNEIIENGELKYDYLLKKGLIKQYNPINLLRANDFPSSVIKDAEELYAKTSNR